MEVEMENDAFGEPKSCTERFEITMILAIITRQLALTGSVYEPCIDSNGNKVGQWEIINE
jgi:hypothetical protein